MKERFFLLILALLLLFSLPVISCGEDAGAPVPGDTLFFGSFPQTAEGTDSTPIEWIVLDVREGKCLLLSRYGLYAGPLHTEKDRQVTWETYSVRSWLNGDFFAAAFSVQEQAAILVTDVDNSAAQGYEGWNPQDENTTQDRVFLLSYAEAHQYLQLAYHDPEVTGSRSRLAPTEYAKQAGAWTTDEILTPDGLDTGWWLLRSPGPSPDLGSCVNNGGSLSDCPFTLHTGCIRPALWIDPGLLED